MMSISKWLGGLRPAALVGAARGRRRRRSAGTTTLLNVSYDPTRELYVDYNAAFAKYWKAKTGQDVKVNQSHGGSGKQARSVIDGLPADVVTLALAATSTRSPTKGKLLPVNWQKPAAQQQRALHLDHRVPGAQGQSEGHQGLGRPDQAQRGVITPNPKTSGGARWNYLAGWAWALKQPGGNEATAKEFTRKLFKNIRDKNLPLDTGARGSTTTFVRNGIGDVLLAWENEALLAIKELGPGKFEIVVPSVSILAEPSVAVVDKTVLRRGTREVATEYLKYLYSKEGQEIVAKNYYRPRDAEVAAKYAAQFPEAEPGDHRRLRRLGKGAEAALRRRRHLRPDLQPGTGD